MKKYFFLSILINFFSSGCENEEIAVVFKKPTIEVVSAFSIGQSTGEVIISVGDVFQKIDEIGVVWSDSPNPTINSNIEKNIDIQDDQISSFELSNLKSGTTYYAKAYYKISEEVVFSEEIKWIQNFTNEWRRLKSPTLAPEEYIYPYDLDVGLSADYLRCYKVNPFTNEGVYQIYFADFGEWNPTFWGNRNQDSKPFPLRFNPIRAKFFNNSGVPLTLYGGGYNVKNKGERFYQRTMFILESNGVWEPYPGAEAPTVSFGIDKLAYVLEKLPNGKLWVFDYSVLKWRSVGSFPNPKNANLIGFSTENRFFMMLEPADNQEKIKEFYEYLPNENTWVRRADFIGENRRNGAAFVIENRIFYGLGKTPDSGNAFRDIWEYDIKTNTWKKVADYPGAGTVNIAAIGSIGRAFIGFGMRVRKTNVGGEDFRAANDFWQFRPKN